MSAVNQSSVPCPKLSTTTTVDFVDVKSKGRGETNRSNSTLLLEPELKTEFKSRAEKRKLTTDNNTNVVLSGSSKQRKLDDSNHPVSNVEYRRGMLLYEENEVNKYDIGLYIKRKLQPNDIYDIENLWRPERTFEITMDGNGESKPKRRKRFLSNWFNDYEWLSYSKLYDGAFCYPCVFFGHGPGHNSGKLNLLFKSPLTGWTSVTSKFNHHQTNCKMHSDAVVAMENFRSIKRGEMQAINTQLDQQRKTRVRKNRQKLLPIVKTVAFCGKQTIPLRGHRDDETCQETSHNKGNFQELLDFRIDSGDTVLKEHFESAPKNATYRSKTVQNEMIDSLGEQIQDTIVNEIKKAGIFSILADETPDISRKEQLAISLRYVDSEGIIQEKFVKFVECDSGTSAKAITEKIKAAISDLGLDISNVRGQGYDGASNMSGKNAGVGSLYRRVILLRYISTSRTG